ncbi:hypothetical protein BY996DRAFT_4578030 [Phakopsora pachyrhizi]|uniref:Serine/threonine-protein phosphatase 2A activator n=1 Tax=Phakopsora pachyrhizi TaxID=170000 RepID=A0AAV0BI09_PHAPC|nr:hypothetical protein BY996DRAFT_4578030 [Phakopsora pachyrhizi]CAH7686931.1 hypothetical protein PPACK8108_LOCUS21643 [Phakopsora pachyrhizi]
MSTDPVVKIQEEPEGSINSPTIETKAKASNQINDNQNNCSSRPKKFIISQNHLDAFIRSDTHSKVYEFICDLNQSVVGLTLDHPIKISKNVESLLGILETVQQIAVSNPPIENKASRFGNPSFRDFYDQLCKESISLHKQLSISSEFEEELSTYLVESWGNRTRIDYGSGMELNFLCWLLCLKKLGVYDSEDYQAIVLKVFWKYIQVMRFLQSTYWLEPAGSHGVWGLDDYHFLPFLFGSSQLRDHKYLRPKSIHDPDVLEGYSNKYMYLACIQFINSIKTASLRWHSPMLDDISGVKTWEKVNSGMIKMYKAEVLAKLPVAQHFLFGKLLPFPDVEDDEFQQQITDKEGSQRTKDDRLVVDHSGHLHLKGEHGWGECCGIPIPSSFAAAKSDQGYFRNNPAVKRIPFD